MATEASPLLPTSSSSASTPKPQRTVTFNTEAHVSSSSAFATGSSPARPSPLSNPTYPSPQQSQPMLATLNSKLRRRNSHGAPLSPRAPPQPASKIGPQRTTKTAQKLTLLPNPDPGEEGPDEESGRDVYSQFTRIKDPTARRDAARLGKADRDRLPRVTAYCTASSYRLDGLMKFLKGRAKTRGANPKLFDECIYTPYDYGRPKRRKTSNAGDEDEEQAAAAAAPSDPNNLTSLRQRRRSDSAIEVEENTQSRREELLDLATPSGEPSSLDDQGQSSRPSHADNEEAMAPARNEASPSRQEESASGGTDFDTQVESAEVFLFDYGTVVIWGMTLAQEQRFLKDIAKFETEKLAPDDVQTEDFNFYYTREYQARIYNDFISLREKRNYMTKLAISHALAQSVKTSLFEDLLSTTITDTTPLPAMLASTGSISLSRREINRKIGELFILRINIHLQGSVLDSPELMWAEPQLEPVYAAVRSYLEMDQRVELMTERLSVLGDLLAVLKDQAGTRHGEVLEWIVIILIAAEILVAAINIVVDLYAGVD